MEIPEKILYRAAIGQILADAGITRSTIQEMVREIIQEKVEKQFAYVAAEEIHKYNFQSTIKKEMEEIARKAVRQHLANVFVKVNVELPTKGAGE